MAEEAVVETPEVEVPEPVEAKVETPDPKKFKREIQPKDKDGKPVGSPHVYYGATEQEVMDKMADAIGNQTWKIRELTLKEKSANPKAPEGAEFDTAIPAPQPKELTADERFQIAEKIRNPETVVEGYRELHKATTGRTPEEDAAAKEQMERNSTLAATRAAAQSFMESHPEYYSTPRNGIIMGNFLRDHKMPTTSIKNYDIAFRELSADGLLDTFPVEEPEPEVVVPVKEEVKAEPVAETRTEAPVKREKTAFPSAITRDQASGTGAVKPKKPSAAEVAMMNSTEYKAYLESQGRWGK